MQAYFHFSIYDSRLVRLSQNIDELRKIKSQLKEYIIVVATSKCKTAIKEIEYKFVTHPMSEKAMHPATNMLRF